jgi:hypothetical protein
MNYDTCAARRRSAPAKRCRVLARCGHAVALTALAALIVLAAGCGGPTSSAASPATPSPLRSASNAKRSHGPVNPSAEPSAVGRQSATSGGALFGGNAALASEEGNLGRRLAIVRVYYQIGQPFPGPGVGPLMADGSTLLVSLASSGARYAQIAAGDQDAYISAFLRAVDQAAVLYHLGAIYMSFEHEPDGPQHAGLGSPAQFVRAWDHVHQLAESAHLDWNQGGRLHWVWILLHSSFRSGLASRYWPGPGEVDVVGADGYNSYGCKVAESGGRPSNAANAEVTPASLFAPAIAFARAHGGLPVFISEWGSDLAPAGAQPAFIRQMQAFVAHNREIGAVMYWDSDRNCNFSVNGNPTSIAALAAMGRSAALQGRVTSG